MIILNANGALGSYTGGWQFGCSVHAYEYASDYGMLRLQEILRISTRWAGAERNAMIHKH